MHSNRSTVNGLGLLALFVTALMTTAGPAWASTASMQAQQIPIGLLRDVSSVTRFPSSALHIHQGAYCDIEGPVGTQLGLFAWGHSRLGLAWVGNDDVLGGSALEAFWAFPLGSFDVGLSGRAWGHSSYVDSNFGRREVSDTKELKWIGTLSLARRWRHRGYVEAVWSAGQIRYEERRSSEHSSFTWSRDLEPDGKPTWRTAIRWSTGDVERKAWLGHLAYSNRDAFARAEWRHAEDEPVRWNEGDRSRIVEGMLGRRVALEQDVIVTGTLTASYRESVSAHRDSPDDPIQANAVYGAAVTGQLGLEASPRDWLRLYAGLAGSGASGTTINRASNQQGTRRSTFDELIRMSASVGVGLHYRRAYLHVLANNSFSTDDPFASASVGWSF